MKNVQNYLLFSSFAPSLNGNYYALTYFLVRMWFASNPLFLGWNSGYFMHALQYV